MDSETVETVTGWESEPFSGGYAGLRSLADRGFTGAVTDGAAWLFVLNGRVVGAADGSIESFEDADGTAYTAPDPSLPLLFAMQAAGGETRAKYYTNDTPLSAANEKLSAGNFTGYVELSENVLSGDYYVVYYGGRALPCAFVGNSRETLTGDEAFDRADDEVGIYEVNDVDIDVVDVPEPSEPDEPEPTGDAGDDRGDRDDRGDDAGSDDAVGGSAGFGGAGAAGAASAASEVASADRDADDTGDAETEATAAGTASAAADADAESDAATAADADTDAADDRHAAAGEQSPDSITIGSSDRVADADAAGDIADEESASASRSTDADAAATESVDAADDDEAATDADTETASDVVADADAAEPADVDESERPSAVDAAPGAVDDAEPAGADAPGAGSADDSNGPRADRTSADAAASQDGDPFSAEQQWRETRSIPSLDPDRTSTNGEAGSADSASSTSSSAGRQRAERNRAERRRAQASTSDSGSSTDADGRAASAEQTRTQPQSAQSAEPAADPQQAEPSADESPQAVESLREELAAAERERDEAREKLESKAAELESAESEAAELRDEAERLRERVEELETELAEARSRAPDAPSGRSLSPEEVLAGTNLFVRYDSRGGATLEKAHAGGADRGDVNDNLRLEQHTEFDADGVVVDGEPFTAFLEGTIEYSFVEWVVRRLLYEIQDTGNEGSMRDLFDAIPDVDRAELHGAVTLTDDEGKKAGSREFDVVLRDRMGNPLVVADVTDSREATTESDLDGLVGDASDVADQEDDLGAAFYVTASFFEPGALEAAADATGGGLLSRSKRKSFVKLARKRGFHLCLVESRESEFHVTVPEL
ncbi:DUF7527 domain-containing protein [Halobaculum sp. D14]|uniref:DUF7527 domain-containing protein n=1 Tax=Halobaculum sp. D14 TaxID=3421642 RepID=UPI003EBCB84E